MASAAGGSGAGGGGVLWLPRPHGAGAVSSALMPPVKASIPFGRRQRRQRGTALCWNKKTFPCGLTVFETRTPLCAVLTLSEVRGTCRHGKQEIRSLPSEPGLQHTTR